MASAKTTGPWAYNRGVYFTIMLQGYGLLLPWNLILNAIPYFTDIYYADCPDNNPMSFFLTSAYVYPQLFLLLLMVLYGKRVPLSVRILAPLITQAILLAATPAVARIASAGEGLILAFIFIIGVSTAVLQSSLFGLTSVLPPIFSQSFMAGQGLAGITAGVMELIIMGSIPDDHQAAALVYFIFAAVCLVACVLTYLRLMRTPFMKHHMAAAGMLPSGGAKEGAEEEGSAPLLGDAEEGRLAAATEEPAGAVPPPTAAEATIRGIFKSVWKEAMSAFLVFVMTFLVLPGVLVDIKFKHNMGSLNLWGDWWFTILILIFNVFDTIGRYGPGVVVLARGKSLLILTILRFGFVPLLLGAAHNWTGNGGFFNDWTAAVTVMLFAITNGYFASLAMTFGPGQAHPALREKAGFIMTFMLQAGILVGSQIAFGVSGAPQLSCSAN